MLKHSHVLRSTHAHHSAVLVQHHEEGRLGLKKAFELRKDLHRCILDSEVAQTIPVIRLDYTFYFWQSFAGRMT